LQSSSDGGGTSMALRGEKNGLLRKASPQTSPQRKGRVKLLLFQRGGTASSPGGRVFCQSLSRHLRGTLRESLCGPPSEISSSDPTKLKNPGEGGRAQINPFHAKKSLNVGGKECRVYEASVGLTGGDGLKGRRKKRRGCSLTAAGWQEAKPDLAARERNKLTSSVGAGKIRPALYRETSRKFNGPETTMKEEKKLAWGLQGEEGRRRGGGKL